MKNLFSTFIIFFIVASAIISLALISNIEKYKIMMLSKTPSNTNYSFTYKDFEYDGRSERLEYLKEHSNLTGIIVHQNGKTIDRWNFKGKWAETNFC